MVGRLQASHSFISWQSGLEINCSWKRDHRIKSSLAAESRANMFLIRRQDPRYTFHNQRHPSCSYFCDDLEPRDITSTVTHAVRGEIPALYHSPIIFFPLPRSILPAIKCGGGPQPQPIKNKKCNRLHLWMMTRWASSHGSLTSALTFYSFFIRLFFFSRASTNRTYLPCPSDMAGDANVDRESRLLRSTRGEKNKYYIKTERCNHVRFQDKPSVMTAIPETQNSSPSLSLIKSSQVRLWSFPRDSLSLFLLK